MGRQRNGARRQAMAALVGLMWMVGWLEAAGAAPAPASSASGGAQTAATQQAEPAIASQVLDRLRAAVRAVRDATARIEAEMVQADGRRLRSVVDAWLIRSPGIVRLQVQEPAAFADQVYVVDFEGHRVWVYLPVTNQVVVQSLDEVLPEGTRPRDLKPDLWLQGLPPELDPRVRLAGSEVKDGRRLYILQGPAPKVALSDRQPSGQGTSPGTPPRGEGRLTASLSGASLAFLSSDRAATVQVWVDSSTWLVERLAVYDAAGREVGSVVLSGLQVNTGLKPQDLRKLPEDAEMVQG